ncbi:short-chain dehydrogenase reductase ATA1-like [Panicum virgatum]|uniref:short-chain dehydrogenase reductase ATA1-like n=1 Tax=Panicum virgatum TaxID=38727 RepID=UPI0019D5531C|nr:short-chain dehydrogenase reductase ATA1-like [Panicum virgatum]
MRDDDEAAWLLLLANKVAVITGAASTVGKAIAQKFFNNGASVFLADKELDKCRSFAEQLIIEKNKDRPNDKTTHLDIFYNNTEFNHVSALLSDSKAFENTMAANFQSVLDSINLASAVMKSQNPKGGCILLRSSTMGLLGDLVPSAYSISQAAAIGVIRAKAAELAVHGVRVNAISQHANVHKRVLKSIFPHAEDDHLEHMINKYIMTKMATEEDVADAAVYLVLRSTVRA